MTVKTQTDLWESQDSFCDCYRDQNCDCYCDCHCDEADSVDRVKKGRKRVSLFRTWTSCKCSLLYLRSHRVDIKCILSIPVSMLFKYSTCRDG